MRYPQHCGLSLFTGLQNTLQPLLKSSQNYYQWFPFLFDCFAIAGDFNIHIDNAEIKTTKEIITDLNSFDLNMCTDPHTIVDTL